MPRFIPLTREDGQRIYVNPDQIYVVGPHRALEGCTFTNLDLTSKHTSVLETPEQIFALIRDEDAEICDPCEWEYCEWSLAEAVRIPNGEVIPISQRGPRRFVELGASKIFAPDFEAFGLKPLRMVPA